MQSNQNLSGRSFVGDVGGRVTTRCTRACVWSLGALVPWLVFSGCTESRSGGDTLVMSGRSEPASPQDAAPQAPPAGSDGFNTNVFAVPQEELSTKKDIPKLTGTITVSGYGQGLLQMDVLLPQDGNPVPPNTPPITVARFKSPGPYEVLIPPGAKEVGLVLILDLKGNGPDAEDPKLPYPKNPVKIDGLLTSGIDFVLDKAAVDAAAVETGSAPGSGAGDKAAAAAAAGQPAMTTGENGAGTTSAASAAPNAALSAGATAGSAPASAPSSAQGGSAPAVSSGGAGTGAAVSTAPAVNAAAAGANNASIKRGADALATLSGGSAPPDTGNTGASTTAPAPAKPSVAPAPAPAPDPAPASTSSGNKSSGSSSSAARPTSADGRPVTDVLDEALDGAPKLAK